MIIQIDKSEQEKLLIISTLRSNLEKNLRDLQNAVGVHAFQLRLINEESGRTMTGLGEKYGFDSLIPELTLNLDLGVIQLPDGVKNDKD